MGISSNFPDNFLPLFLLLCKNESFLQQCGSVEHPYLNDFQVPNHRCMIVKMLELEKDKVRLVIQGQGHTFMNALVEELLTDSDIDVARYVIEFQFSDPELFVTTKGKKNPLPIIKKACKRISGNCNDLIKGLKKK